MEIITFDALYAEAMETWKRESASYFAMTWQEQEREMNKMFGRRPPPGLDTYLEWTKCKYRNMGYQVETKAQSLARKAAQAAQEEQAA